MSQEEATINPDGSQEMPPVPGPEDMPEDIPIEDGGIPDMEDAIPEVAQGVDPAIYLLLFFLAVVAVMVYVNMSKKKSGNDEFFDELDGDKFNLKLPTAADEYYKVKDKCMDAGWEPGTPPPSKTEQGPHRILAQALMKRCIADIPMVTFIQKESPGMNKLYSQSMCSVKQWRSYQAAEALVSGEVEEVRAEADEIEPGWSEVIWSQAMQYHKMLKQKHEQEAKAAADVAAKKKSIESKVNAEKKKAQDAKDAAAASEQMAKDLIKQEERESSSKKAFSSNDGMKKGFLNAGGGSKKK